LEPLRKKTTNEGNSIVLAYPWGIRRGGGGNNRGAILTRTSTLKGKVLSLGAEPPPGTGANTIVVLSFVSFIVFRRSSWCCNILFSVSITFWWLVKAAIFGQK